MQNMTVSLKTQYLIFLVMSLLIHVVGNVKGCFFSVEILPLITGNTPLSLLFLNLETDEARYRHILASYQYFQKSLNN